MPFDSLSLSLSIVLVGAVVSASIPALPRVAEMLGLSWEEQSKGEPADPIYRFDLSVEYERPLMLAKAHTSLLAKVSGMAQVLERVCDVDASVSGGRVDPEAVIDEAVLVIVRQENRLRAYESKCRELEAEKRLAVSFGDKARIDDLDGLVAPSE